MTPPPRPPLPGRSVSGQSDEGNGNTLLAPTRIGRDGRSYSSATALSRGQSYATTAPPPGSFSSDLKSTYTRSETPRPELGSFSNLGGVEEDGNPNSEQRQAEIRDQIDKETKIKIGSENLLEALNSKSAKQSRDQKLRVEAELNSSNRKIQQLNLYLQEEIQRSRDVPKETTGRLSQLFRTAPGRSPSRQDGSDDEGETFEPETESPTFVLSEILQALEADAMQPEFYVGHANALVELFKRHPTLKYDLAWSIFGLRMQTMLLSDSREVAAAGYRLIRYAITDRRSLQTIRALHTDYLVILSLVKESKASVEREQALKFVRAFLDVKDGVQEISRSIIRIIVAIAEHSEDRLRNICTMTLAEILIRDPPLLVSAGGIGALTDALGEGNYYAAESIAGAFLYLLDVPNRRRFLTSGYELGGPFASFTDSSASQAHGHEERLRANAKVIAALFKSWPGLLTLCMNDFITIKSLVAALYNPTAHVRNVLLEVFFDILRIKPPSWSSSFLAGRRLTTYGRVTNLKTDKVKSQIDAEDETTKWSLVDHFTSLVLSVLIHSGLIPALLFAEEDTTNMTMKRKTSLLLGEVLKMAHEMLPQSWGADLQVLPGLLRTAAKLGFEERFVASGTIYQVDSVSRTLYRSNQTSLHAKTGTHSEQEQKKSEMVPPQIAPQVDEGQFRTQMLDTQVLNTVNYAKWNWPLIQIIIDGALLNPKRLDEALRSTKFVHRLLGFYRPFKYRFSDIKNTKPNQRYVRAGCALIRTLLQNPDGIKYLAESKFIRQLAECLSQFDRLSGITSDVPIFSVDRISETLTGGYFAMLGALSKDPKGLYILERWKIINMFYHIIELRRRDDLIKTLLSHLDYDLDGHLRIIVSKAMTSCSKDARIFSTRLLRRYATKPIQSPDVPGAGTAEWAIRLLVTQLYDPEIEVCEVAIKILEEACNEKHSLEFVVKCRPALDHLGEIGAPLLLRFLSTSVGYHYLDGLDYISREMDDWFLGRNDTYVALIEASLARALADVPEKTQQQQGGFEETLEAQDYGLVPPHFYRELTRTKEGCKLLEQKGHFDEFTATIQDFGLEDEDAETIIKVKGSLWAVGNVGSMALGAPFLEKSDVVKWIVQIAEKSLVLSLRGTAFFVLGLISRSLHGQEILLECGWDGAVNEMGDSLGYCIPLEFTKLFSVQSWSSTVPRSRARTTALEPRVSVTDSDPTNARILKLATDLGNTVLAKKAANDLHRSVEQVVYRI
ncbi:cytosolic regulator pianissimo [Pseudovirgaria hyperparasitica]|uniref:Cytosolic regulator pianissimo n=1 Tax=Pseudovirgaria hyperparasitica TaxID=470096 RepID=A0A6A6WEY8_9PEZI|nr:cytosolic regulator pianissimo [Pseudovirgaria hyperparasitica]KAF2761382.1 cytosolic regulator pianissimo [Pseudovirgaria hyperparasitica]